MKCLFWKYTLIYLFHPPLKVQSHLSGLSTTVNELEHQHKQRAELQDWIKKQQAVVADWSSRPSKLRPEAAKQEIVAMNDLLNATGDKRSQLITEMTGSCKLSSFLPRLIFNIYFCSLAFSGLG